MRELTRAFWRGFTRPSPLAWLTCLVAAPLWLLAFEAWVAAQQAPPVEPTSELAQSGMEIFVGAGACTLCHIVGGTNLELEETTPRVRKGPNLTHYASRQTLAAGMLDNTAHNLTRWLEDPNELKPDNLMSAEAPVYITPALALDDSQIAALVAYLQSLK